jgi:hypothetical protein
MKSGIYFNPSLDRYEGWLVWPNGKKELVWFAERWEIMGRVVECSMDQFKVTDAARVARILWERSQEKEQTNDDS